jgi:hypothetical protein
MQANIKAIHQTTELVDTTHTGGATPKIAQAGFEML